MSQQRQTMNIPSKPQRRSFSLLGKPDCAEVWHLWTVVIPRRSITGRLVRGVVWRRLDGRRWIYKKFVDTQP